VPERVVVVGAGMGGLAAALALAARGVDVHVVEAAAELGGKLRPLVVDGAMVDAGPTVLTMRDVFDDLFAEAGANLDDHLKLTPATTLARHAWDDGSRLDLHADRESTVEAIADFAGRDEAERFRVFAARARAIYETLAASFIRAPRPNPLTLARAVGPTRIDRLWAISPFVPLWRALGEHFRDGRLRQLFGRYATYCGSSPFAAPATLMLVAHVELEGVWLVDGGMDRLAAALGGLAAACGARFSTGVAAREIATAAGRVSGVTLATGATLPAHAVVFAGDVSALGDGLLGPAVARAAEPVRRSARSLSALTWSFNARTSGFPLLRHNVFFSDDYRAEFDDLFARRTPPRDPTVYVCAQDRDDRSGRAPGGRERGLVLVNAPPDGDRRPLDRAEIERCRRATLARLERHGLTIEAGADDLRTTTPTDFARLYPGTGGAIYGRASHGWMASFRRPGSRTKVPGLYLAGGSVHPGPGLPMAALSGRLAAASVIEDLASTRRSLPAAMRGGTSTR
jgi:1-hydroxycarotenoid 3,4-desaturase